MTAKNPHTSSSIRDQWTAQQRAGHRGASSLVEAYAFDEVAAEQEAPASSAEASVQAERYTVAPVASAYSRYDGTGKYAPGSAAGASGAFAPVEGTRAFMTYGVCAAALSCVWLAWAKLTVDGSVMGSSAHFLAGMGVLGVILLGGIAVALAMALLSRGRGDMDVSTTFAVSFGKTAVAMLGAVVVWFVCLLVASN